MNKRMNTICIALCIASIAMAQSAEPDSIKTQELNEV